MKPDDTVEGLTKRVHPPRERPEGFFRRLYEERKDGASLDLLRLRHSCSQDIIRKALAMFGGDPLPKRGSKPKGVTVAVPLPPAEPVRERRTFTPYTAAAIGITWMEPVKWHVRCERHGRVEQFCTDCKRSRA